MNNKITKALAVAFEYHHKQKRDDGKSYFVHIFNVYQLLKLLNPSPETLIAGLLHDILEDTDYKEKEIKDNFGSVVLDLVKQLTNDTKTKIPPIKSKQAWLIKFCDIIDNCTDMKTWDKKRIMKYLNKKRKLLRLR